MPPVSSIFLAATVTLRVYGVHSRLCLPDAIPEFERQNVVVDGISMPIGIWSSSWDSALIVSSIYQILVQEKLGYNCSVSVGNSSKIQLWKVAGCEHDPVSNNITGGCGAPRHQHVTFEFWHGADAESPTWSLESGNFAPENLGSIGYSGTEGMHIMRPPITAASADSGSPSEHFRSYNRSWYNPSMYTATVAQVDSGKLRTCAESVERWKDIGQIYLAATGDVDGLEDKDGKKVSKCWQEKWWAAPACRQSIPDCASVITTKDGLGMPYMIQQAFFHNMPSAFAMASENFYVALNSELQGLSYWWAPDTQFALQKPYQLMFPPHSPSQYKQQIYKTMKEKTLSSNWMAKGFHDIAERPAVVASKLQLGDEDIKASLVAQVEAGNQDPWDTACNWLLQSDHSWQDWLPNETTCSMGKGLVDSSDNFTQRRGMAVKCAPCRPGHQSVEQDRTRVCIPCDAGHYQPLPGESTCLLCEPGTRSESKGQTECIPCSLGRFANRYAMTSCVQCGPADQTERWTTSEAVMSQREQTWIQIQGADSEDYCSCVEGTYLWKGRCEVCVEGSRCPGSNELSSKPGYFSKPEAPGDVFRCYGRSRRCPGGAPGNCAAGRDSNSLSCTSCLPGLHETEDLCIACGSKDYVISVLVGLLCVFGIALSYVVLVKEGKTSRQPGSLLIAALGLGQMVTVVQQLTVIQQFKIVWGQPFSSILEFSELLAFDSDMVSIGCVAPLSPVLKFSIRTLSVLLFFVVACMVHCVYIAYKRAKTFRISLLLRTVGTLFMVFFISLCSSISAPFRCHIHPNGLWTVQSYDEVFCDGTQEHSQMALVGGFACLLPVSFLVVSVWIIVYQLPKRSENADVQFIRACSFLFIRFRPGAEVFSVLFLARNTLVVLCPSSPSSAGKVVCMNILLYGSIVITAFYKPWRAPACNFLDLLSVTGMLVILDMGSLFVTEVDTSKVTATCVVFFSLMFSAIAAAIFYGIAKHFFVRYRKQFRFFLCHQKVAAGSLARLSKMELQKRGPQFNTFVDCDDSNDPTRVLNYVGQDTETSVVSGSPELSTRKWCVGEICTARIQRVDTVVLALPGYVEPDKTFIESYSSIVPDITESANYNLGSTEVEETSRWISTVPTIAVPFSTPDAIELMGNDLTGTSKKQMISSGEPDCVVLADLENIEAVATAYISSDLISPKSAGSHRDSMPAVLTKGAPLPATTATVLMICSEGCFRSVEVASWSLTVIKLEKCCVLPIIAEDGFRFPSQAFYDDSVANQQLSKSDSDTYVHISKAVFEEIAVVFPPENYSSTQEDLDSRSKQVTWRLQSGALKPLASKLRQSDCSSKSGTSNLSNHAVDYKIMVSQSF